jgi:hypothetical protein
MGDGSVCSSCQFGRSQSPSIFHRSKHAQREGPITSLFPGARFIQVHILVESEADPKEVDSSPSPRGLDISEVPWLVQLLLKAAYKQNSRKHKQGEHFTVNEIALKLAMGQNYLLTIAPRFM